MAINAGDVVLTFLADTTQLDQAFAQLSGKAVAATGSVSTQMGGVVQSFGMAGTAVQEFGSGLQGTAGFAHFAAEGMHEVEEATHEAKGTMGLFNDVSKETLGVALPRHVRSFIAELPGVASALNMAFSATAILFIVDALIKVIEKTKEWLETGEQVEVAMEKWQRAQDKVFEGFENGALRAEAQIDDLTGNHLEALHIKLQLIDNATLRKLMEELDKLTEEALKTKGVFDLLSRGSVLSFFGMEGSEEAKTKLEGLRKELDEALSVHTPEAYNAALKLIDKTLDETRGKLSEMDEQQKAFKKSAVTAGIPGGSPLGPTMPDPNAIKAWQELQKVANGYFNDVLEAQLQAANETNVEKLEGQRKAEERLKKAAEERFKVYGDIKKSEEALNKELDKGADEVGKRLTLQLASQLKEEEKLGVEKLRLIHQQEEAAIAAIDGEMKAIELATQRKEILLQGQYNAGKISAKQYMEELRILYQQEAQDLLAALNRKEALVILEAKNEAAQRGKIITDADAKELRAYVDLENKKAQVLVQAETKIEKQEEKVQKNAVKRFSQLSKLYKAYEQELMQSGKATAAWGAALGTAISSVVEAYAAGSISIGEALQRMVAAELQAVGQMADVKGTEQLAKAFGSWPDGAAMAHHFASAALWFSLGGALALGSAALSGGGNSGGGEASTGSGDQIDKSNPNTQPAQNPSQNKNVPHLSGGGLVMTPTLAIVGDSRSGGGAREGVLPLDDDNAMEAIAGAIAARIGQNGGTHFHVKGMISADTLGKTAKKLSRQVQTGRVRLMASNSHKITKRG